DKLVTGVQTCALPILASTLAEFQRTDSRKVSAHYVIDRNGDIYQMVDDADCANHCMGANAGSIGIEHVGGETDVLAAPQAAASRSEERRVGKEGRSGA